MNIAPLYEKSKKRKHTDSFNNNFQHVTAHRTNAASKSLTQRTLLRRKWDSLTLAEIGVTGPHSFSQHALSHMATVWAVSLLHITALHLFLLHLFSPNCLKGIKLLELMAKPWGMELERTGFYRAAQQHKSDYFIVISFSAHNHNSAYSNSTIMTFLA